jgi:hypothetical protein
MLPPVTLRPAAARRIYQQDRAPRSGRVGSNPSAKGKAMAPEGIDNISGISPQAAEFRFLHQTPKAAAQCDEKRRRDQ